jgi:hypothetical protein
MTINFGEIVKNKYFVPVLIGVIIAIVGIYMGSSNNGDKSSDTKNGADVVSIKEKKDLKSLIFGQKNYELAYGDMDLSTVENISFFEAGDDWKGDGFFDWRNFYEGKSSVGVASSNNKPGIIYLEKNLDLSSFDVIEFSMSINEVDSLESAIIKIGDSSLTNYYSYTISNLFGGWKFMRIPKSHFVAHTGNPEFGWNKIEKIQFEILSRPGTTEIANFDYLTAVKSTDYLSKWKMSDENFLSLGKINDKIALLARNEGTAQAVLNEARGDNFVYQASFIPQTAGGAIGLFFRGNYGNSKGYYLLADGINKNSFTLRKLGVEGWEDLKTVEISNFILEKDQKYWLKAEARGEKITGYVSVNGADFTELFSVNDGEFSYGGVGVAVFSRGYGFFDDFKFEQ